MDQIEDLDFEIERPIDTFIKGLEGKKRRPESTERGFKIARHSARPVGEKLLGREEVRDKVRVSENKINF